MADERLEDVFLQDIKISFERVLRNQGMRMPLDATPDGTYSDARTWAAFTYFSAGYASAVQEFYERGERVRAMGDDSGG